MIAMWASSFPLCFSETLKQYSICAEFLPFVLFKNLLPKNKHSELSVALHFFLLCYSILISSQVRHLFPNYGHQTAIATAFIL